jgi:hypothetical protein
MTKQLVLTICLGSLLLCSTSARADDPEAPAAAAGFFWTVGTATTIVLGATDLIVDPSSIAYGVSEIAIATPLVALDAYVAYRESQPPAERAGAAVLVGFGILEAAIAVHGAYVIAHHDERVRRTMIVPVPVSDGRSVGAGLGLSRSF